MKIPEKPRVGRPPAYTPEQLLARLVQAAIDLLAEQGADADVSVAQIAARAKVSKKTVYMAIASKEELISHVIRHNVEAVAGPVDRAEWRTRRRHAPRSRVFLAEWEQMACGSTAVGIYVMAIRERSRYPAIGASYFPVARGARRAETGKLARTHTCKKFHHGERPHADGGIPDDHGGVGAPAPARARHSLTDSQAPELAQRVAAVVKFIFPGDYR